jgi:flagellar export protein FliJ
MAGKFRLQQVLDHKRRQEEEKTLELATLTAEQRRSESELRQLRDKEEAQLQALQDIARVGAIDPSRLDSALWYLDAIEGSISRQLELVASLEEKVLESRDALIAILKEKQLLEKLEERQASAAREVEQRLEGNQLDEIAAQRFLRRGGAEEAR